MSDTCVCFTAPVNKTGVVDGLCIVSCYKEVGKDTRSMIRLSRGDRKDHRGYVPSIGLPGEMVVKCLKPQLQMGVPATKTTILIILKNAIGAIVIAPGDTISPLYQSI